MKAQVQSPKTENKQRPQLQKSNSFSRTLTSKPSRASIISLMPPQAPLIKSPRASLSRSMTEGRLRAGTLPELFLRETLNTSSTNLISEENESSVSEPTVGGSPSPENVENNLNSTDQNDSSTENTTKQEEQILETTEEPKPIERNGSSTNSSLEDIASLLEKLSSQFNSFSQETKDTLATITSRIDSLENKIHTLEENK